MAKRGHIVIYPRYQATLLTPPREYAANAIRAIEDALRRLQKAADPMPDSSRFALVGHSMGGVISAQVAARARSAGLPVPRALMCVEPGGGEAGTGSGPSHLYDLSGIPPDCLLLCVAGEDDRVVGRRDAVRIFQGTPQIPLSNKDFVTIRSDDHGNPPLRAHHGSPTAPKAEFLRGFPFLRRLARFLDRRPFFGRYGVDALDYYGYWKLFDGLTDCAFYGKNRAYALGDTPQQRYMGCWSDGTPVVELAITDHPETTHKPATPDHPGKKPPPGKTTPLKKPDRSDKAHPRQIPEKKKGEGGAPQRKWW
jgi:pimeloyl-ACP methyl ester carboxylesterase